MSNTSAVLTTWNIDPAHSRVEFKVKHMMISNVKGSFSGLAGMLTENTSEPSLSQVEATVDIATLNTGDDQRDVHLKSADFFDVDLYPQMTFSSKSVEKKNEEDFAVTGDLTLHGITKSVTFAVGGPTAPAKDLWGNMRIGLSATTRINRRDFGLVWNAALESGGILVGEEIQISLDVQLIKA
jgi:polyisoprenoid-binding protein YceI